MFSIFSYIMSRVTHSEPGLPMGALGAVSCIVVCERFDRLRFKTDQDRIPKHKHKKEKKKKRQREKTVR